MRELLESRNWYLYSQCSCGGPLRLTFRSNRFPGWEVDITPGKNSFIIKRNNISKGSGKTDNLEAKLKEYEIY
jgi:hypothetical protein